MEYEEIDTQRPKQKPGVFGRKAGGHNKDNTALILSALVVLMIAIIVLSVALNLVNIKNPLTAITGNTVLDVDGKKASSAAKAADVKTIKNIKFSAEIYAESFEIPAESMDVTLNAEEVQIISPTMDITVSLDKPMVMQAFTGRIYWRDGLFILEGKLSKYLADAVQINWKSDEDLKIRVLKGSVEIPQVSVPAFETVATGSVELADKVTLSPDKDLLKLDHYRGSFRAEVDDAQTRIFLKGATEDMSLGDEQLSFNVQ